jgi:hypothetical protein
VFIRQSPERSAYPLKCSAHPSNTHNSMQSHSPIPGSLFYEGLFLTLVFLEEVLGWGYGLSCAHGLDQRFMGEAFVARPLKIRRWTVWTINLLKLFWQ